MDTIELIIHHQNRSFRALSGQGISLSLPVERDASGVNAYFIPDASFNPFCIGSFVGSVEQGGACNCEIIQFCAHGNGTHTETVAHVSKEHLPAHMAVKQPIMLSRLVSIRPEIKNGDRVIALSCFPEDFFSQLPTALIVRTLLSGGESRKLRFSGSNPCYFEAEVCRKLAESGVKHLLFDQPSVDREEDGGMLAAHKAFFYESGQAQYDRSITELIEVPEQLEDGLYLLNLMVSAFASDAAPSCPVVYPLEAVN